MSPLSRALLCEGRSGVGPMSNPLRGRHFMGGHSRSATHRERTSFRRLSFAYFSLARQRKVGAAPHRGDANKPKAKQGTATTAANKRKTKPNPDLRPKPKMLEVEALNQYYGGSHILRDVKLTVPDGKLTVLLGRNGVGKTTLLRCLMGTVQAKSGSIAWRGTPLTKLPTYARVAQGLAYVPQGRDIFPRLTVEENLLVGAASKKAPSKIPDRIYELFPVL